LFYGFLGTAFGFLLNILTLVLRYEKKSKSFMVVTILGVILNFLITYILLVKFRLGILAPILGTMLSNGMSLLFLFLFMMNSIVGKIQHDLIKILLNFGLQSSITGICFFFLDWVDRLIIKELLPMSDVGIYSLAYRLGSMINVILVMPFGLIWAPIRLQYLKKDVNDVFVTKVISYFFLAGIFIVFIATSYNNLFMSVFFKNKEYYEASKIFPIIMLAMLIFGLQNILDFGIYYYKKIYYYIFISIIGVLFNVGFNVLFIPKYGIYAAAYITLATYLLSTTLIFITSNKYHLIRIEWVRITILAVFILVIYYLMYFTNIFNFYGDIKRLFLIFFSIALFYRFWFDKKERDQILLFFKK
jgi:O-antigen/teichoic acid export membrane protein